MYRTSSGDAKRGFASRNNVRRNTAKHFKYKYENKDIVEGYCKGEIKPRSRGTALDQLRMGPT